MPRVDCASTAKLDDDDDERANKKRVVVETTKRRREKEVFMMRDISGFVFIFDSIFFQFKTRKYTGLDLLFFFFFLLSDEMMVSDSKLDSDDQTFQIKTNLKLKIINIFFFFPLLINRIKVPQSLQYLFINRDNSIKSSQPFKLTNVVEGTWR